jgi:hypothetical protein
VLWRSPTAQPEELALPHWATTGSAHAIDEDGTIVGNAAPEGSFGNTRPIVWHPDGTVTELPIDIELGDQRANSVWADQISNGWVAGRAEIVRDWDIVAASTAALWHLPTGQRQLRPSVTNDTLLNAQGWVLGRTPIAPSSLALVTSSGQQATLTLSGAAADSWVRVAFFSADGRTLAGTVNLDNDSHPIIWRCR